MSESKRKSKKQQRKIEGWTSQIYNDIKKKKIVILKLNVRINNQIWTKEAKMFQELMKIQYIPCFVHVYQHKKTIMEIFGY